MGCYATGGKICFSHKNLTSLGWGCDPPGWDAAFAPINLPKAGEVP
jgi:hypothetical protein